MAYRSLITEKSGNVLVVKIIGPLDSREKVAQLSNELMELFGGPLLADEMTVVIITGSEGSAFSIGVFAERDEEGTEGGSLARPVAQLDRPVIAAINGDAIGQGFELALACDIRIAAETSRFGMPHIKSGLIPWDGGTQRLSRLAGIGKAMEMVLTGEMIDGQEAYRLGLVSKLVPPGDLMAAALTMGQEMASKGPIALRYAKEAISKGMDLTLEQGLRLEADLYFLLHTTGDRTEGIHAFREKRPARFEGK